MKVVPLVSAAANSVFPSRILLLVLLSATFTMAPRAGEPLVSDSALVTQNGVTITVSDVAQYINFNLAVDARVSGLERERAVKQIVENLYVLERLHQEASEQGRPSAEQVKWVSRYEGIRFAAVKYIEQMKENSVDDFALDWESSAREYYLAHLEEFSTGDRLELAHILVSLEGRSFDEWQQRVAVVRQKLSSGAVFEDVAQNFSDDEASARLGGSLGIVSKGQMIPRFEQAAFQLAEAGAISDPILTRFGLHIIQLKGKVPAEIKDFESVKRLIKPKVIGEAPETAKEKLLLPYKQEVGGTIAELDDSAIVAAVKPLLLSH